MGAAQPGLTAGWENFWQAVARRTSPYVDAAIAVVATVIALASLLRADVSSIDPRLDEPDAVAVIATAMAGASLGWRRVRPAASYIVFVLGALVVTLTGHYIGVLSVLLLLSLYSLAAHGRRRDALVGLAGGIVTFVTLAGLDVPDLGTADLLEAIALMVAAWALGDAIRSRRQQQREHVVAAITEERLRIARELHDVVAHSMSLIAVQAGVGAHVIRSDPDAAEHSLEVIADTSRKALEQTRSMLGVLRDQAEAGTRPPTQGLADLDTLVHDVRRAGLEVELVRTGDGPELDAAASLTAYRVVQESLTNIIKHSAARSATVTLGGVRDQLHIEVTDPGPHRPRAGPRSGHGLTGLDERVRLVGGQLEHGTAGAGFRVHASIPAGAHR